MAIQAQAPDGTIHEFPDGTPDAVVDRVMKSVISGQGQTASQAPTNSTQNTPQPEPQSGWDKFTTGLSRLPQLVSGGPEGDNARAQFAKGAVGSEYAAGRGALRAVSGDLGDRAIGALASATTRPGEDPEALAREAKAQGAQLEADHPLASTVGKVAAGAAAARALGSVGVTGAAVQGAAAGGLAGFANKGDVTEALSDAGIGAVGGKVAQGAGTLLGAAADRVVSTGARIAGDASRYIPKAVRALADRISVAPADLVAARTQLMQSTGRPDVSWGEAAAAANTSRLQGLAKQRPAVAQAGADANAAADAARPANTGNLVQNGQVMQDATGARLARTQQYNDMMAQHGDTPVTIQNPGQFNRRAVVGALRQLAENSDDGTAAALRTFQTEVGTGSSTPGQMRLRDLEDVRQALAGAIERDPALTTRLGPIRDALRAQGNQVGPYRRAMNNFEQLGDYATGTETGSAAASPSGNTQALATAQSQTTRAGDNGVRVGFRTKLAGDLRNKTGQLPADYMSPGFQQRAEMALGPAEGQRVTQGLAAETTAGRNLQALDTGTGRSVDPTEDVKLGARALTAVKTGGIGAPEFIAKAWGKLRASGLSNAHARDLTTSLFSTDPVQNNIAATQLQRLGIIRDARDIATARAALIGGQAGGAMTQNDGAAQ